MFLYPTLSMYFPVLFLVLTGKTQNTFENYMFLGLNFTGLYSFLDLPEARLSFHSSLQNVAAPVLS